MRRALLSIITLLFTAPLIEAKLPNIPTYSLMMIIDDNDQEMTESEMITDNYLYVAIERLKNIEEILLRLSKSLEIGDEKAAELNYIKAHYQYESIRPLVLLFPNIDQQFHVHEYELTDGPDDPQFTGFHAIEYALFKQSDFARAFVETQKLLSQIKFLIAYTQAQRITLEELLGLLPVFTQQIILHKIPGNENIHSGSDLGNIFANIEGINLIVDQIKKNIPQSFIIPIELCENNITRILSDYKDGDYYQPHAYLKSSDKTLLFSEVTQLSMLLNRLSIAVTQQLEPQKQHSIGI